MRYLLRPHKRPRADRILLVESGSRQIVESVIPNLRHVFPWDPRIDLVTCFAGLPKGIEPEKASIYRVSDFATPVLRGQLYRELKNNDYQCIGIVCSAEPIMTKWKWMLALRLPAHVFLLNENGDYVWLDRLHAATIWEFARFRAGFEGTGAVRTAARLVLFPFTLIFLALYAAVMHTRRAIRL